jgi:hypothetical protein
MITDYSIIPERIMGNLLAYVEEGQAPGDFLYAVLTNNLFEAVFKADSEIKPIIPILVFFIHWEIPSGCHGSEEIVKNWLKNKWTEKI